MFGADAEPGSPFVGHTHLPPSSEGTTLCELNGALVCGDTRKFQHIALPAAAPDTSSGYGFARPELPAQPVGTPGRTLRPLRPPGSAPTTNVGSALAAAVGSLQAGLERGLKRALDQDPVPGALRRAILLDPGPVEPLDGRPFAWQCAVPAAAAADAPTLGAPPLSASGGHLCAAALADHSVALYDLSAREWSPHKLVHTQQRGVESLAWQPQGASTLAVGCAKGVCMWRLAYSPSTLELSGAHMLRLLEAPGHAPVRSLCWHPRGRWLVSASACQGALQVWDAADAGSATALWMVGGGGVRLLEASPCGLYLLSASVTGGVRVWETRGWQWESWRRFAAPCATAAWSGPPPLGADTARTLLIALQ
eukprot:4016106-Prymnesium_polylepis.1